MRLAKADSGHGKIQHVKESKGPKVREQISIMYARPTSHAEALGPGCAGPTLALPYPTEQSAGPSSLTPSCGAAPFTVDPSAVAVAIAGNEPRKHTQ